MDFAWRRSCIELAIFMSITQTLNMYVCVMHDGHFGYITKFTKQYTFMGIRGKRRLATKYRTKSPVVRRQSNWQVE